MIVALPALLGTISAAIEMRTLSAASARLVVTGVAATQYTQALVRQVSSPVQWEAVVGRLASEGVTTYVEVGPGTVLGALVRKSCPAAASVSFRGPDDLAAVESAINV